MPNAISSWADFYAPQRNRGMWDDAPAGVNAELRPGNANAMAKLIGFNGQASRRRTYSVGGMNEGGETTNQIDGSEYTPEFLQALQNYRFAQDEPYHASIYDQSGRNLGSFQNGDELTGFDKFAFKAIPLALAAAGGAALGGYIPGIEGVGGAGGGVGAGFGGVDAAMMDLAASGGLSPAYMGGAVGGLGGAAGGAGGIGSTLGSIAGKVGAGMADLGFGDWAKIGAQLGSALLGDRASSKALDAQLAGSREAIGEQRRQFDLTRADFAPYRDAGVSALGQLQSSINTPTTAADVMQDPGYQFGLEQGQQAIDRKIAASGGRVSGAAIKAAGRFGTNYAATGYTAADQRRNDRLNRLAALAGIGQTATGSSAMAGMNATNAISDITTTQGSNTGASRLQRGNIWGNTVNSIAALYGRGSSGGGGMWAPGYDGSPDGWTGQH